LPAGIGSVGRAKAEPPVPSRGDHERRFWVERQSRKFIPEELSSSWRDFLFAGCQQKTVRNFGGPMRWNNDTITLPQAFE
jgi:hypothetical protein